METHTAELEIEPSNEQIDTPEELKERQRIQDIMSARRDARNAFIDLTTVEIDARRGGYTDREASELAARYVYRHVTAYVEELAYHLRTTDAGKPYYTDVNLGSFTPDTSVVREQYDTEDRPTPPAYRFDPDPVTIVGLGEYIAMGETHTLEMDVPTGDFGFTETHTVETAMPVGISRRAYRATNHFTEELLGLELNTDSNTIGNLSLSEDGETVNYD